MKVIDMRSLMHRHSVSEENVRKGCEELDAHLIPVETNRRRIRVALCLGRPDVMEISTE